MWLQGGSANWWNHLHNQHHSKPNVVSSRNRSKRVLHLKKNTWRLGPYSVGIEGLIQNWYCNVNIRNTWNCFEIIP